MEFNPIIQIMMPFGKRKEHSLMLNYKRTMSDIPYSAISSAITWKDAYNYSVGNANLKAPSSDMLMVGLSMFRNKVTLTAIYATRITVSIGKPLMMKKILTSFIQNPLIFQDNLIGE